MPAAMYEEFPEIRAFTRVRFSPETVKIGDRFYSEEKSVWVDSSFTDIFTLHFIEGSPGKNLNEPKQVLIDRSTARKYFGEKPALDKIIILRDSVPYAITGVYEDLPSQAHFHFNMLVSLVSSPSAANDQQWFNNSYASYMRLEPGYPSENLEAKLPAFADKYLFGGNYADFADEENYWHLYLQHIREIHLGSDLNGEFEANGNLAYIRIFSVVAFLVLVVACINFMNLTTASSSIRSREIGVRKTNGASKGTLRIQFFAEAIIVSILALILAMGLVESIDGDLQGIHGKRDRDSLSGQFPCDSWLTLPGHHRGIVIGILPCALYEHLFRHRFAGI